MFKIGQIDERQLEAQFEEIQKEEMGIKTQETSLEQVTEESETLS